MSKELTSPAVEGELVVGEFLDEIAAIATQGGDRPSLVMGGTFAMYAIPSTEGGGLMCVYDIPEGQALAGTQRVRIPPHLIRAMVALAGGSKLDAVKALIGKGRKSVGA
jgi:hypothetical protein